jgi:hypothetical protein
MLVGMRSARDPFQQVDTMMDGDADVLARASRTLPGKYTRSGTGGRPSDALCLAMNGEISARTKGTANITKTVTTTAAVVRRSKLRNSISASLFIG